MRAMKRRLIVMRHAKSDWNTEEANDHARPLNKRGRRDAPQIALRLIALDWVPDAVFSSDAKRTQETWGGMADHIEAPASFLREFYGGSLRNIRDASHEWDDQLETVMVLGHNPGWEDIVWELSGQHERMTTANAALLVGAGATWSEALEGGWAVERVLRPKEL